MFVKILVYNTPKKHKFFMNKLDILHFIFLAKYAMKCDVTNQYSIYVIHYAVLERN